MIDGENFVSPANGRDPIVVKTNNSIVLTSNGGYLQLVKDLTVLFSLPCFVGVCNRTTKYSVVKNMFVDK